jgi:hypothetical protein
MAAAWLLVLAEERLSRENGNGGGAALDGAWLEGVGVMGFWVGSCDFFGFLFGFLAVWWSLAAASLALDVGGDWGGLSAGLASRFGVELELAERLFELFT